MIFIFYIMLLLAILNSISSKDHLDGYFHLLKKKSVAILTYLLGIFA